MKYLILSLMILFSYCSVYKSNNITAGRLSNTLQFFDVDPPVSMIIVLDPIDKVKAYIRLNTTIETGNNYFNLYYNDIIVPLEIVETFIEYKHNIKRLQYYAFVEKDTLRKIRAASGTMITNLIVVKDNLIIQDFVGGTNIMKTTDFILKNILHEL